jgi:hypothetical protein
MFSVVVHISLFVDHNKEKEEEEGNSDIDCPFVCP